MHTHPQHEQRGKAVRIAIAALLMIGLAGCGVQPWRESDDRSTEVPYVGVFTGQFVDGRPVYRFPTIVVLGSRRSVTDNERSEGDPD